MPTQAVPYEFVPDIRRRAEELRMANVRQAVRGSIQAHSVTADMIATGVLNVGSGAVTVDDDALTARMVRTGDLFVGGAAHFGEDGNVTVVDGAITAPKLSVGSLDAITATLGTVTAGDITSSTFDGGTITGSNITLGSGVPRVYGDNTGIRAIGDMASYRFFEDTNAERTAAVRCNLPTVSGVQYLEAELTAYTAGPVVGAAQANIYTQMTIRTYDTDVWSNHFIKLRANGDCESSAAFSVTSDRAVKKQIADVKNPLDAVLALRPRRYAMRASGRESAGFVAQEVEPVIPELVSDNDHVGTVTKGLQYDGLHAYTVGAIQELVGRVEALERK